jgi:dipeptidase
MIKRAPGLLAACALVASQALLFPGAARACTSIMVGRGASVDGSVMTSHTCDSNRTGTAVRIHPALQHRPGGKRVLSKRGEDDSGPMPRYKRIRTGTIPQVKKTHGYIDPAYASMNQHQLAIGESTFGGREELVSKRGLIDCVDLTRLLLERARTARQAIRLAGELLARHGWNDEGEALTLADPREVWLLEIVGPGKGKVGAIWAARRVPDGHVSVVANASRIGRLELSKPGEFLASKNVRTVARERKWWNPNSGQPFRFNLAYNPRGRTSFAATRREWRVLSLLAPSLKLQPNANEFPFSIKPEKKLRPQTIMSIFRDTYEGTPFDMVRHLTVTDKKGKTQKSPLANPFMPYDALKMLKIHGGWGEKGERTLARWYCMYATVTQSRSWLPDPVGGVVWFGYDNPAMTTYVPLYAGITDLPRSYKTDGRSTGFSRQSAWWAFNRAATIAAHRWGEMRRDVAAVRDPLQKAIFARQRRLERRAAALHKKDPPAARRLLTEETNRSCHEATRAYWKLGDRLWTRYDEKW